VFRELIHSFRHKRHGKADEQHSFNQDDGKFQVRRECRWSRLRDRPPDGGCDENERDNKEDHHPMKRQHEPVQTQDVIDLVAVFGGIRRLTEELVDQGKLIHTAKNLLRSTGRTALSACERAATDETECADSPRTDMTMNIKTRLDGKCDVCRGRTTDVAVFPSSGTGERLRQQPQNK